MRQSTRVVVNTLHRRGTRLGLVVPRVYAFTTSPSSVTSESTRHPICSTHERFAWVTRCRTGQTHLDQVVEKVSHVVEDSRQLKLDVLLPKPRDAHTWSSSQRCTLQSAGRAGPAFPGPLLFDKLLSLLWRALIIWRGVSPHPPLGASRRSAPFPARRRAMSLSDQDPRCKRSTLCSPPRGPDGDAVSAPLYTLFAEIAPCTSGIAAFSAPGSAASCSARNSCIRVRPVRAAQGVHSAPSRKDDVLVRQLVEDAAKGAHALRSAVAVDRAGVAQQDHAPAVDVLHRVALARCTPRHPSPQIKLDPHLPRR